MIMRFFPRFILGAISAVLCMASVGFALSPKGKPKPKPATISPTPPPPDYRLLVNRYCVVCHNQNAKIADLMLDKADFNKIPEQADVWEKVDRKLRSGMMPPQGMPRPDA